MNIKITLLTQEYPPYILGGVGSFSYDLAKSLSQSKIPTTVITSRSGNVTNEKINENLHIIRLPFFNFPPRHLWFQIQNFNIPLKYFNDSLILHCTSPDISLMCLHLKQKIKKPIVTSIHGFPIDNLETFLNLSFSYWNIGDFFYNVLEYPLNNLFIKRSLLCSDHIILCSYSLYAAMKVRYPDYDYSKVTVINNSIMLDAYEDFKKSEECEDLVLYFGRLTFLKGLLTLIKAIFIVKQNLPNIKLEIFGKGPLEISMIKLIKKLKLENNVFLRGYIPRSEMIKKIRKTTIVALPSIREGQSISLLESMASKKAVIACDLPFSREVIKNYENGVLVKPMDPNDLAENIILLLSDKKLRKQIGEKAYFHIKKYYNWDINVKKYIDVYKKTLDGFSI